MALTQPPTTLRTTTLLATLTLALVGCATTPTPVNLADAIAAQPSLSTFTNLVAKTGLAQTFHGTGPYTVFAPTNDAFKALPASTFNDLTQHPEKLKAMLSYHVVRGTASAATIKNSTMQSLQGANLAVAKAGDFVTVESAAVVQSDLQASNGVIHTIDTVLLPPKL